LFEFKPDFEISLKRMDAFWERELIDRPVVQFALPKSVKERHSLPVSNHPDPRSQWMDAEYQADLALAMLSNYEFFGDTLPVAFPNLGPDVFAALYGCPLEFAETGTSWSKPILDDLTDEPLPLDWRNVFWTVLDAMTDALLETGRGRFLVGLTDLHPGGDCLAALRDPQNLAMDLLEQPERVVCWMKHITTDYLITYEHFYQRLVTGGQPITTTWTTLACRGRFYMPSCDFSIMVSPKMFARFFLPAICEEVAFLDHAMYHLDGPGALRHLDLILDVPGLQAIQFVPTESDAAFLKWAEVYRKIQNAGKALQVSCTLAEIKDVMDLLRPQGIYLAVRDVPGQEEAEALIKNLERWTANSAIH
jgi:hypothetical protein